MDALDYVIAAIKVLIAFGFLLTSVMFTIWAERRVVALMQQRIGPNRTGPFGLLQALADGVKLFFKEDIMPSAVDRGTYLLAPFMSLVPALLTFAVVPVGADFRIGDRVIQMQVADLNVGILFFLAMGSMMVYGVVLAGWSSGSVYPLLGGVRSTAQMISYEIGMGLAIVAVVMYSGTLSTRGIVDAQAGTYGGFVPRWFVFAQLPAFLIFLIAGFAETNRAPFDLPEAETELVAGFHTEYSGIKFAMFFLAEYVHVITTSAIATTLFLGGWRGPILPFFRPIWPVIWFLAKVSFLVFLFMWARATLPRYRYDKLMRFGWKVLIPVSLAWIMVTGLMVVLPQEVDSVWLGVGAGAVFAIAFTTWLMVITRKRFGTLDPLKIRKKVLHGAP
ncbi:MAG TPA: NADH-quinone oxidoreductase subunit NuoH [Actinomycetota bacterium]|nr:NADH-quinone oxidoreductase subunit NuoH [Actinomycetota bacterium]